MKPASEDLKQRVDQYVKEFGRVYAPILHPDFAHVPTNHGDERVGMILPHLQPAGGTLLDIGTHWGYMAHRFEDAGFRVTAVEHTVRHFEFLRDIRDVCGRQFEIVNGDIFDFSPIKFDIIIALSIFHHFLKTKAKFEKFEKLLARTECGMMIFQPHAVTEPQMKGAYRNMDQDEFAAFVANGLRLNTITVIGREHGRNLYKLSN